MQRRGGDQANDGGAIRVGDKRAFSLSNLNPFHGLRINLRYDERHAILHPKSWAVVDNNGAAVDGERTELFADGAAGAEERYVDAIEAVLRKLLDDVAPALEGDVLAGGALGGEHFDGAVGEFTVSEDGEELLPDGAGDADNGERGGIFLEGHPDTGWAGPEVGLGEACPAQEVRVEVLLG